MKSVKPAKPTLKQLQNISSAIPALCCTVKDETVLQVNFCKLDYLFAYSFLAEHGHSLACPIGFCVSVHDNGIFWLNTLMGSGGF